MRIPVKDCESSRAAKQSGDLCIWFCGAGADAFPAVSPPGTGRSRSDCRGQRRERRSLPSGRLGAYLTTSRREVSPGGRSAEATRAKPSRRGGRRPVRRRTKRQGGSPECEYLLRIARAAGLRSNPGTYAYSAGQGKAGARASKKRSDAGYAADGKSGMGFMSCFKADRSLA